MRILAKAHVTPDELVAFINLEPIRIDQDGWGVGGEIIIRIDFDLVNGRPVPFKDGADVVLNIDAEPLPETVRAL